MSLPKTISYDDLNGQECKEILAARFWQFMEQIPEFQQRFALTRVKLRLEISMDIWGASPPRKVVQDSIEMTALEPLPSNFKRVEVQVTDVQEVDAFNNPPDLIREEHGLPLPRGQRQPTTGFMETVPVILEGTTPKFKPAPKPEALPPPPATLASPTMSNVIMGARQRKPYAAVVELDHGSVQRGERGNEPVIGDAKFQEHLSTNKGADVPPQFDFVHSTERTGKVFDDGTLRDKAGREKL